MKLIDLYKKWMETGEMVNRKNTDGGGGLCNCLPKKYDKYLNNFSWECHEGTFWAYPLTFQEQLQHEFHEMAYTFTPLRQTIVLLICAMCDEL